MSGSLLETIGLKKYFKTSKGLLHAVDDINLHIARGETVGVVGESGCGKSTLGRTVLRLIDPSAGKIIFDGQDIMQYDKKQMKPLRREMQIIFQDPYSSLDPRMCVSDIIAEPMTITPGFGSKRDIRDRTAQLMQTVGLAARLADAYPHELDGGRRQRIGIVRHICVLQNRLRPGAWRSRDGAPILPRPVF